MALETADEVRAVLKALGRASWQALHEHSGVPISTIEKIAYGVVDNPGYDATVRLVAAIEIAQQGAQAPSTHDTQPPAAPR